MKILLIIAFVFASLQADAKHFTSIQKATSSFILALEQGNKKSLADIFTPKYKKIIKIRGVKRDEVKHFLNAYKSSHHFLSYNAKSIFLEVGKKGWTFPIPLIKDKKGWHFDIELGIQNIITREVGRNELAMIEALRTNASFEELTKRKDLTVFNIFKDKDLIVAIPKEYDKTAVMSFVVDKNGNVYQANLKETKYMFDKRFKKINVNDWKN